MCARFLHEVHHAKGEGAEVTKEGRSPSFGIRFNNWFNRLFTHLLDLYELSVRRVLRKPGLSVLVLSLLFVGSLAIYPFLGLAFFPQTDAGQFTINLKVPTGARIESTEEYVTRVEKLVREVVDPHDFKMVVSNIGIVPDFSALYTTNSGPYTATLQVELKQPHQVGSFEIYGPRPPCRCQTIFPDLRTFITSGSLVDTILNMGMPAPIDKVSGAISTGVTAWRRTLPPASRNSPGIGSLRPSRHELSGTSTQC
ncbi:MAG: efflux RND transporter permease subunit [Terriglobia bacterium]